LKSNNPENLAESDYSLFRKTVISNSFGLTWDILKVAESDYSLFKKTATLSASPCWSF